MRAGRPGRPRGGAAILRALANVALPLCRVPGNPGLGEHGSRQAGIRRGDQVVVLESADPDYFVPDVDLTEVAPRKDSP